MLGFAQKKDNCNISSCFSDQNTFFYQFDGDFWTNGESKNYAEAASDGMKIGILGDFFEGSIKIYLNDIDQGYAVTNSENLKQGVYFATIDPGSFKGSITLV